MRNILQQYWPLLTADHTIKKYIQPQPQITYRRSPSLRDKVITSHHAPKPEFSSSVIGTFPCGHCDICEFIYDVREKPLPNGQRHKIKHKVTCQTTGIVYLATCTCGSYYVGKTKRQFCVRIRDHIKPLYKGKTSTSINRHIAVHHDFNPHVVGFTALEHIPTHVRGGDIDQKLLQLETKWIHTLDATRHPGLNEGISFKPFL